MPSTIKLLLFAAALVMFVLLFDTVTTIFFVTILASLIAIFFLGTADYLDERLPGGRRVWVTVMIVLILGTLAAVTWIAYGPVASQVEDLGPNISPALMQVNSWLAKVGLDQDIVDGTGEVDVSGFVPDIESFAPALIESVVIFFVVLVVGVFLTYEPGVYRKGLLFFAKDKKRTGRVIDTLQDRLYRWTIGRLASMAAIFVLTWAGLAILGAPLAFLLALIAGLLSFIPNFGPIFSALLAAAVGLSVSPAMALWILGVFVGVQLLESNLINPLIERQAVYLPPGLLLIVEAFMGLTFGILGLIVATPIVVGVTTILKEYHANK